MKNLLAIFLSGLFLSIAQGQGENLEAEKKKLQGTWTVVTFEKEGKPVPEKELKGMQWVFAGDKLAINRGKKVLASGTFKLLPGQTPSVIDYREGPDITSPYDAMIYQIEGETLKVCTSADRKKRPSKFESKEAWLFVLKKVKK